MFSTSCVQSNMGSGEARPIRLPFFPKDIHNVNDPSSTKERMSRLGELRRKLCKFVAPERARNLLVNDLPLDPDFDSSP
jgi:hypothetical protein